MTLNLAIIHLDLVIEQLELEPGEYSLGRSSDNNIVIQHLSIQPNHGKVVYREDGWFFRETGKTQWQAITDEDRVSLGDQLSLATKKYVETSESQYNNVFQLQSARKQLLGRRLAIVSGLIAVLAGLIFAGYQQYRVQPQKPQTSQLLKKVRDKIVELEFRRESRPINDFKKYAGLEDKDFKERSGFCTGFLVGPNIVLTAAHCMLGRFVIDMNNKFYLRASDDKNFEIKEVLGFDIKRDYLFLRTEGMDSYGHLEFDPDFRIEQKVYTVGNVHGEGIAIRDGIISSESTDPDDPSVKFIRYSAGTSPGNSGGPLLSESGDIIALVFASTMSENFNLGTPSRDLLAAYEKYVQQDTPQKVNLSLKRLLNFKPSVILQALSLPYLPQFDEYPEVSEKFQDISVDIDVPLKFEMADQGILQPLNEAVVATFKDVQKGLRDKNEIILDWTSFVSAKTPAILPSQFDVSQSVFNKIGNRYYPLLAGLIDSPDKSDFTKYLEQLEKEKKFDFQAYGYNVQISQDKIDLLGQDIFYKPKDVSGNKPRLQKLAFGAPYSQMLLVGDDDLRQPGFFGLKLFLKNFVGDTGVIASTLSKFVRPLSAKDFTIQSFEFESDDIETIEVKDRFGRSWRRERLTLFEGIQVFTYCMSLPEGPYCVGRIFNVENAVLFELIENNFRQFVLSHLLINPFFWEKDRLISFLKSGQAKNIRLMNGVSVNPIKGKKLSVDLAEFPVRLLLPNSDSIESLRLQTGLLNKEEKASWAGYGLEWVQRAKDKDMVCGAGLEVFSSQSNFILNYLRDRKKQEKLRKIKGEDPKPLPGVWYKPFRGLKVPFQLYGYCAPLEEDPRVEGQYFVDFKNAKPYKVSYKINK